MIQSAVMALLFTYKIDKNLRNAQVFLSSFFFYNPSEWNRNSGYAPAGKRVLAFDQRLYKTNIMPSLKIIPSLWTEFCILLVLDLNSALWMNTISLKANKHNYYHYTIEVILP